MLSTVLRALHKLSQLLFTQDLMDEELRLREMKKVVSKNNKTSNPWG